MADAKPQSRGCVGLRPDRWKALCDHFSGGREPDWHEIMEPVEIAGILYLPAQYFLVDEATYTKYNGLRLNSDA
jgi:hypothetical protein